MSQSSILILFPIEHSSWTKFYQLINFILIYVILFTFGGKHAQKCLNISHEEIYKALISSWFNFGISSNVYRLI
jgi:hypothetical protein